MKKTVCLIVVCIILLLSFGSCKNKNSEVVHIAALNGTTGFTFAKMKSDDPNGEKYDIAFESDASVIAAKIINGEVDIAALPTNAAANLFNKMTEGNSIKMLCVNTLGCLYLVTTDASIKKFDDLNGKTIYVPAQNPTFITSIISQKTGVQISVDNTYAEPSVLKDAVAAGRVDYAVLPEPMVTIALRSAQNNGITLHNAINLTQVWNDIDGLDGTLVQGCVVVRESFLKDNEEVVRTFLSEYQKSVDYLSTNPTEASDLIVNFGLFNNATLVQNALPNCNVTYLDGTDMKTKCKAYYQVLYTFKPQTVGNALPGDDFYYEK